MVNIYGLPAHSSLITLNNQWKRIIYMILKANIKKIMKNWKTEGNCFLSIYFKHIILKNDYTS